MANAQVKRTVNVATAGTLSTLISDGEKYTIDELTLTGNLNGTDFRLIRDMAGHNYQGMPTNGKLKKLDIAGAKIVAGGDMYLDALSMQFGNNTWGGSDYHKNTSDNVLGAFLFAGCTALEEIKLPSTITTIENSAFQYCTSLKGLEIPKSVNSIFTSVISDCNSLESLVVENGNSNYTSDNCNAVISGTTLILGCKNTVIPDYITEIGNNAFYGCSGFKGDNGKLTLPSGLKSIGAYGLADCSFSSIVLPNGLEKIDYSAFARNYALTAIIIPASVTYIGRSILEDCINLSSIVIADGNTVYDSRDNCNAIIETATNKLIEGFEITVIPTTITTIGEDAYYQCLWLKEVAIPEHITSIEQRAYWNCQHLKDIYCYIKVPFAITMDVFENLPNTAVLHVPSGTKTLYEATDGWKDVFSGRIYEINSTDPVAPVVLNVSTAGTLSTLISDAEKYTIEELTITGNLNGTDFRLIRDMAGNDYMGQPTNGMLKKLDLSGANIVAGGDAYFDLDNNYINLGNTNYYYGFDDAPRTSEADTFGEYLFAGCQQLQTVKTPTSLIKIGNRVFAESGLSSIDLNSGLTTLGSDAFWQSKLSSITIPKTVTQIGDNSWVGNPFAYISQLTSITLEEGNSRYSMSADGKLLIDNTNHAVVCALGNSTIPEGVTVIGSNAFCDRQELVNFTIPNWVTEIGGNSFSQCGNLESVVISNNMTKISSSAFTDCMKLTDVTIPSSVTSISFNAFGNTGLTEITIPSSVTSIAEQAFAHNQNLTTVISYITNPFDINDNVFAKGWDFSSTTYPETLKVPYGTKALYQAKTGWNKITNIVEMDEAAIISIGKSGKASYWCDKNLDFSKTDDIKAFVVTGYDYQGETSTIWLTRVKDVPAGTPIIVKGTAGTTYNIPIKASSSSYYENMLKGNTTGDAITLNPTEGDYMNMVMSGGQFWAFDSPISFPANMSYLQLPKPEAMPSANPGSSQTVKINNDKGKVTLCSTVDLDFSSLEGDGVKAFTVTGYDNSSSVIWMTRVTRASAGVGLIVKGPKGEYSVPSSGAQTSYANMLVGNNSGSSVSLAPSDATYTYMVMNKGEFWSFDSSIEFPSGMAYLRIPKAVLAMTRSSKDDTPSSSYRFTEEPEVISMTINTRSIGGEGDTTVIHETKREGVGRDEWYTLQGQRVAKPGKGLYIRNGKKVVIK